MRQTVPSAPSCDLSSKKCPLSGHFLEGVPSRTVSRGVVGAVLLAMRIHVLVREQELDGTPDEVFGFFGDAHNLEAITPPLLRFTVITPRTDGRIPMAVGTLIEYRLRIHGLPIRWQTLIQEWVPGVRFVDAQLRGPYALWHHTHEFQALPGDRTLMRDTVRYAIGFGPFGDVSHRAFVARDVAAIFDHRARVLGPLLAAPDLPAPCEQVTRR